MRARIGLIAAIFILPACGINQQPTPMQSTSIQSTLCEAPRPQVCTMEYAPACANLIVGQTKQYSSGCNACADDSVASYLPGPCSLDPQ